MDALHPRLLVADFPACFAFYDAVLPPLLGAHRVQGSARGPYAHWDVGTEAVLVLFDRAVMARTLGADPGPPGGDAFVCRVPDVDAAYELAVRSGAAAVLPPTDRPEWGEKMRTAHLRDPEGRLIEFQSY
ncbi:VOC family protein [Kitasatospora sp. NPDC004272]